jgi:sortase A
MPLPADRQAESASEKDFPRAHAKANVFAFELQILNMEREPHDLSIEELERLLAAKRQAARRDRIRAFSRSGRAVFNEPPIPTLLSAGNASLPRKKRRVLDTILLAVELLAIIGLVVIVLQGANIVQNLNREAAVGMAARTPSATPLLQAVVLPSGHTPPTSPGGAVPNLDEIPASIRPQVQFAITLAIPTRGPEQPLKLDLPALGKLNLPILEGDTWDQLKQGVGHHLGSGNPGATGNVVLSAHNDIYGELFRDLDRLQPGDEILLYSATRKFQYLVTSIRIVAPTDLSVLSATERPTLTLISCYPYMIDNQRIVVVADQTRVSP